MKTVEQMDNYELLDRAAARLKAWADGPNDEELCFEAHDLAVREVLLNLLGEIEGAQWEVRHRNDPE